MLNLRDGKILVERYTRLSVIDDKGKVHFEIPEISDVNFPFQLTDGNIILFGRRENMFPLYSEKGIFLGEIKLGIDIDVGVTYLGFDRFICSDDQKVFTINGILGILGGNHQYHFLGLNNKEILAYDEDKITVYGNDFKKLYEAKSSLEPSYPKSAIQNGDNVIILKESFLEIWSLSKRRMIAYIDVDESQYMILLNNGNVFVQEFETQLVYDIKKNNFIKARDKYAHSRKGIQLINGTIATISKDLIIRNMGLNIIKIYDDDYPTSIGQFPGGKILLYWMSKDFTNLMNDKIEII